MKIKFEFPPDGEKDSFSRDVARAEWFFKLIGWLIVIGTLKYAAVATGHASFTFWAFALTLELGYLAFSFVHYRVKFEIVSPEGKRPRLRTMVNIGVAAFVGWLAWQAATWIVNDVAQEIVEFNRRGANKS